MDSNTILTKVEDDCIFMGQAHKSFQDTTSINNPMHFCGLAQAYWITNNLCATCEYSAGFQECDISSFMAACQFVRCKGGETRSLGSMVQVSKKSSLVSRFSLSTSVYNRLSQILLSTSCPNQSKSEPDGWLFLQLQELKSIT